MDDEGIFLIRDGALVVMKAQPYESEDLLQQALAQFPAVLAGGATSGEGSGKLMLVRREMGVPSSETSGSTWSLDHLFLDRAGVPVVVEVKRASDTRIRREVVGQMLDYAANAVKYWPVSYLRAALERTAEEEGTTAEAMLADLRPDVDPEEFWTQVDSNLAVGRIRMLFVADVLPPELVRIIEFLNEQMAPAEVLGVAVPQFVGGNMQVLVPRLVGATSAAAATKQQGAGTAWNESTFSDAVAERCTEGERNFFQRLLHHVSDRGGVFSWGRSNNPGLSGWYAIEGSSIPLWSAWAGATTSHPSLQLWFPKLRERLTDSQIEAFAEALACIPTLKSKIEEARIQGFVGKYPSVRVSELVEDPARVQALFAAFDMLLPPSPVA